MADLVMIVPSRGRPEAAEQLVEAFRQTCLADTALVFAIDDNDPRLPGYRGVVQFAQERQKVGYLEQPTRTMGQALDWAVRQHISAFNPGLVDEPFAIGFCGDDHRPRTVGWDKAYLDALRELGTGIVYGNDLLQGENIPTQVAMTSDIIRALGYMAPPTFTHLYVDNFWKVLGNGADCLRYLPDVIVEHLHPVAGKAEWDEGYKRVNSNAMYERDKVAFDDWLRTSMLSDVAKVRALR